KLKTVNRELIIVGTGPEKEKLIRLVNELGISERVIFLDWMKNDELPALLNSADIFVYPSTPFGGWEEQFGYAMAEASACGVPVVATQTGSISEVIKNGQSGILVDPNSPDQLAEAINKVLSDDNLKKQMGEHGRKYIIENFSHQVVASKISDFLRSFIDMFDYP
ncbi:MAG: glycosyltransferase family 4 protein, partial [Atribacterota bacterium]|nr:glycosyltransferase family 4 protein [Atribacterota bacterium]